MMYLKEILDEDIWNLFFRPDPQLQGEYETTIAFNTVEPVLCQLIKELRLLRTVLTGKAEPTELSESLREMRESIAKVDSG